MLQHNQFSLSGIKLKQVKRRRSVEEIKIVGTEQEFRIFTVKKKLKLAPAVSRHIYGRKFTFLVASAQMNVNLILNYFF
jgi:hypothetical protein